MLDNIRAFVSRNILRSSAPAASEPADPSAGMRLAACALLLELAYADNEFSVREREHLEAALGRHFDLDEAAARELIALAEAERREAIDHFQFTRLIAEHYDLGQKMVLAEVMWGVIQADGQLRGHETYLVRKLAHLLKLEPAYLAQARRAAGGAS